MISIAVYVYCLLIMPLRSVALSRCVCVRRAATAHAWRGIHTTSDVHGRTTYDVLTYDVRRLTTSYVQNCAEIEHVSISAFHDVRYDVVRSVNAPWRVALVSAAKVMRCTQCSLVLSMLLPSRRIKICVMICSKCPPANPCTLVDSSEQRLHCQWRPWSFVQA